MIHIDIAPTFFTLPLFLLLPVISLYNMRLKIRLFNHLKQTDSKWEEVYARNTFFYKSLNKMWGKSTLRPKYNPSSILLLINRKDIIKRYVEDQLLKSLINKISFIVVLSLLTFLALIISIV